MAVGIGAGLLLVAGVVRGQVVIADNYTVTGTSTGFTPGSGVNLGISPPATRLTGTAAANLRYISTGTKATTVFGISGNKLQVTAAANPGRFTLSANGTTPFSFEAALGTGAATVAQPVTYDVTIRVANGTPDIQRCSFALATAEGDATTWDFGFQVYRTADTDNFYTIGKRIDTGSSGLTTDVNSFITNTAPGTAGSELSFLMRVTDAGTETTAYHSRVRLSLDGGTTWFYDTQADADLPNGWGLNGPGRYILWDVAPDAGTVTYDNFSIVPVPAAPTAVAPANGVQNVGAGPALKVIATNLAPGNVTVTYFGREVPAAGKGADFLMAVLPDTQNYAREDSSVGQATKEMWFAQTDWIVTNRVQRNIAYVAHLGDCVHNGDVKNGGPNTTEWKNATNAMYRLENPAKTLLTFGIPYGIAVGNHDQDPNGAEDGTTTFYNDLFGSDHFDGRPYYGGHYSTNNDNHYDLFSASGLDFIVFYFEYGRYGSGVLDWANNVLENYPDRRVIAVAHSMGGPATPSNHSPQGEAIYEALKTNPNFFLMLGGHVDGEGSRSDTFSGRTVRTFISNYQFETNGGNGWMRLMYFSPSNNLVSIKTYSPWLNQFRTDANSQMSFPYNMDESVGTVSATAGFAAIGTNVAVTPGSLSAWVWSGLTPNRNYEWYARVTDAAGNTVNGPVRSFRTTVNSLPVASNLTVVVTGDQPTTLTLPASDANGDALTFRTNSRAIRGLNTAFDSAAGTITYQPARGYRGLDQFTFSVSDAATNSANATVNLTVAAPADTNANGLPDAWETRYGVTNPSGDDDGDGLSNLVEYQAGTNPTNGASGFRIQSAQRLPGGNFQLNWSAIGGTRYRIQYANGTTNGGLNSPFTDLIRPVDAEMDPNIYGTESTQTFTDAFTQTGAATNNVRYYRVKISP